MSLINGTTGDDTLPGEVDLPDVIRGDAGNDTIDGRGAGAGGTDELFGDDGDDLITGTGESNSIEGGDGNDTLRGLGTLANSVIGGAGHDLIVAGAGDDVLSGDDDQSNGRPPGSTGGNDVIVAGSGADQLFGGAGDDILQPDARLVGAGVTANDLAYGDAGNDTLVLLGRPQDYSFGELFGDYSASGNGSNGAVEGVVFNGIERIAFGIGAQALAAGGRPLLTIDFAAPGNLLPDGSNNYAPYAFNDTIQAGRLGDTRLVISIADLLVNDLDRESDSFVFGGPVWSTGVASGAQTLRTRSELIAAGLDPALYAQGALVVDLLTAFNAPVEFGYYLDEPGTGRFSNEARFTVSAISTIGFARDDTTLRGTIGEADSIPYSVLLANDDPGLTITGLVGGSSFGNGAEARFLSNGAEPTGIVYFDGPGFDRLRVEHLRTAAETLEFQYEATDASGNLRIATVTLNINNNAPIATNQSVFVAAGGSVTVQWRDIVFAAGNFDADGDPFVLSSYGFPDPTQGTLAGFGPATSDPADFGSITFTPIAGFTGTASIHYEIRDEPDLGGAVRLGTGGSQSLATLSFVVVTPVPLVGGDDGPYTATIGQSGSLFANRLFANDTGNSLKIAGLLDDRGTPDPADDQISTSIITAGGTGLSLVTLPPGQSYSDGSTQRVSMLKFFGGADSFTYVLEDAFGSLDHVTVSLNFTNRAPVAAADAFTFFGGGPGIVLINIADILANDSDPDGQALQVNFITTSGDPGSGTLAFVDNNGLPPNQLRYTPSSNGWTGTEAFTYGIIDSSDPSDGLAGFASAMLRITVNAAPAGSFSFGAPVAASSPEGNTPGPAQAGSLVFTITRSGDVSAAASVTFTVGAGSGGTTSADIDLITSGGNGLGTGFGTYTADFASGEASRDITVFAAGDRVPEADEDVALTLISATGGTLSATGFLSATGTITNDDTTEHPPVANDDTLARGFGPTQVIDPATLLANDFDLDNTNLDPSDDDTLTITAVTAVSGGSVALNPDQSVRATFTGGPLVFTYTLSDGTSTDTATVTIPGGLPPVVANPSLVMLQGQALALSDATNLLRGSVDPEGGALTVAAFDGVSAEGVALARGAGGALVYAPPAGFTGTDRFGITISDVEGFRVAAEVSVRVQAPGPLFGTTGAEQMFGAPGDDTFYGFGGGDLMAGGGGTNLYQINDARDSLLLTPGANDLAFVRVDGWSAAPGLVASYLVDGGGTLDGSAGDDVLVANSALGSLLQGRAGRDMLWGKEFADAMFGDAGDDVLRGFGGNDLLVGGAGADQLVGGAGADTFVFDLPGWGYDQVFDFDPAEGDRLDFRGSGVTGFAQFTIYSDGVNTAVIAPDGSRVDVYGRMSVTAGDVILV